MRKLLTVIYLNYICDELIQKGYGERSVLLGNDTEETGYHGIYYGIDSEDEYENYITQNQDDYILPI